MLERCFAATEGKKATKNNRIEAVIASSITPISKREIMSIMPDVSQSTVESSLAKMIGAGLIEKIGANKSARYRRI